MNSLDRVFLVVAGIIFMGLSVWFESHILSAFGGYLWGVSVL